MSNETRTALTELFQILLLVGLFATGIVFSAGLGLLAFAKIAGSSAPAWASVMRDVGAIGAGFCAVGEAVLSSLSGSWVWWPPPKKDKDGSARAPKDAA
jgi:hypothetical protein